MKHFTTAAAISVTLFVAGCSSDSTPSPQAAITPTTPVSTIPAATPNFASGLAVSGGFSSLAGWRNGDNALTDGNIVSENDNSVFSWDVTTATPGAAFNQNLQQTMVIEQGKSYTVKFKARSDRSRTINVGIGLDQAPWDNATTTVTLATDWQDHEVTLTAPNFGDAQTRLFFEFAEELGLVMLDEISIVEATVTTEPSDLSQIDLPVSFEGTAIDYTLTDFGGASSALVADPSDAAKKVVRTVKSDTAETWAGTTLGNASNADADKGFASVIPFTAEATTISVRVYSPEAGTPVRLKVERSDDGNVKTETEELTTVANEWETMVFDLSVPASGADAFNASAGYDKASIFFNFGISGTDAGEEKVYLWDDVVFGGESSTAVPTLSQIALPVNFDSATVDYSVTDFGGNASALVDDPQDASNKVMSSTKGTSEAASEGWAGTTASKDAGFAAAIPFSDTATEMTVRIYSPASGVPVLLKVEDASNAGIFVETLATTSMVNSWETLTFNFSNPGPNDQALNVANTYNKASIFFDFNTPGTGQTYYWDDLQFVGTETAPILSQVDLPISFDSTTVDYTATDFGGNASTITNDPTDASNKVMRSIKGSSEAASEGWAGTTASKPDGLATAIPFSDSATEMTVRIYSPASGTPVLLKVEDASNAGVFVETLATTTTSGAWETLTFDFSNPGPNNQALNFANTYNKVSIFFNFNNPGNGEVYFWDDLQFVAGAAPTTPALSQVALPIGFDSDTVNYTVTDFGGAVSSLTNDPLDASNKVMSLVKSATAEGWAGTTASTDAGLASAIPFSSSSTQMSVRVYSPSSGTPVLLKVEDASDAGIFVETLTNTATSGAWETLTFDFSNPGPNDKPLDFANTYNKVSIFFNFLNPGTGQTYYWDDLQFVAP